MKKLEKQSTDPKNLGVLYEAMQDDIKKILEIVRAGRPNLLKIPRMAESIETLEYDINTVKLATMGNSDDFKILKIRTEKTELQLERTEAQLDSIQKTVTSIDYKIGSHEKRLTYLEAVAA